VSTTLNHLLKAPFVVHPSTGRLCVPFTAKEAAAFRPEDVPTLQRLVEELQGQEKEAAPKTSLSPYVDAFDKFCAETRSIKRSLHDQDLMDIEDH
jgi:DNA primase small subunit